MQALHTVHPGKSFVVKDTYNGIEVAVKTTISNQEIINAHRVKELKKIAPPAVTGFLPVIHDITGNKIVMELLEQRNSYGKDGFVELVFKDSQERRKKLKEYDLILAAAKISFLSHADVIDSVSKIIYENIKVHSFTVDFGGAAHDMMLVLNRFASRKKWDLFSYEDVHFFYLKLATYSEVPLNFDSYFYGTSPLIDALLWLRSMGLSWEDLHHENLLSRSGQDVLVDFESYFSV